MNFLKRLETLSEIWRPFTVGGISLYAAGACFYILMSIFPALLFLLALLPWFPGALGAAMDFLHAVIPNSFVSLIDYIYRSISTGSSLTLLSVSALTTLWSASKGILAMMDGLNAVIGQPDRRLFLWRRAWSVVYFLLLAVCLLATLLLHVLGQRILTALLRYLPGLSVLWRLLLQFRMIYTLPPLTLLFTVLYRVLPSHRLPLRHCVSCGLATSAAWLAFSSLFSVYVDYAGERTMLYGGIGFLILAMIWLQICILMFLYGGILCALLERGDYHPLKILKKAFGKPCS